MASGYPLLPIASIAPSPYQARTNFDQEAIQGLADSMEKEGLLEPILVRKQGNSFELISGERRLRAAKLLGWPTIEAKVIETKDEADAAAKGLVENLQRQDLNPIEEAEGFKRLNQLDGKVWTQAAIAKISGRDPSYISQSIALLDLPHVIKENISRLMFSRSHALELLRLSNQEQQLAVAKQIPGRLTREETRQLVDKLLKETGKTPSPAQPRTKADTLEGFLYKEGFQFTEKGPFVEIRANWKRTVNFDGFIAQFRASLLAWCATHPFTLESGTVPAPDGVSPQQTQGTVPIPEIAVPQRTHIDGTVRLPATPQERAELNTLAAQGPGPVYAWVFGPNSPEARQAVNETWKDQGVSDPLTGVQDLINLMGKVLQKESK